MKGYCVDCKHFQGSSRVWYDQHCTRVTNEKVRNHISGELEYPGDQKYPHAREVNNRGQCDEFEEKS